jgi:ATP-binding cassette subfamily C protein
VIVVAHRPSAIASVNKLLYLQNGMQIKFGPKADVLKEITVQSGGQQPRPPGQTAPSGPPAQPGQPVVAAAQPSQPAQPGLPERRVVAGV